MKQPWIALLAAVLVSAAHAGDFTIEGLTGDGRLVFAELHGAMYYRVLAADTLAEGAWHPVADAFPAAASPRSVAVPFGTAPAAYYRIVAEIAAADPALITALPDEVWIPEDAPVDIGVLENDTPPSGQTLAIIGVESINMRGVAVITTNQTIRYFPPASFKALRPPESASEVFLYTVRATAGQEARSVVTVNLEGVNDPPLARTDLRGIDRGGLLAASDPDGEATPGDASDDGVLANDADPDAGDLLEAVLLTGPTNALAFDLLPNGLFTYQHNGSPEPADAFIYAAQDLSGAQATGRVEIAIRVPLPPWQHPENRFDVNDDTLVTPVDVLELINEINANGPRVLPPPLPGNAPPPFYDVDGDDHLTPQDVLSVINYINARSAGK